MTTYLLLTIAVLLTSTLSGVFAMGGGAIMIAILLNLFPVAKAMIFHGVIQASANGFRALLSYKHIHWVIIINYFIGALFGFTLLWQLTFNLSKPIILISVGLLTLIGPFIKSFVVDVTKRTNAILCGFFMVLLNSLIGASGSVLNLFFIKSPLNRYQIIATKSTTQVIAHTIKIIFYSKLSFEALSKNDLTILPLLAVLTLVGGYIGKLIVNKMSDKNFKAYSGYIISAFGLLFLAEGIYLILSKT